MRALSFTERGESTEEAPPELGFGDVGVTEGDVFRERQLCFSCFSALPSDDGLGGRGGGRMPSDDAAGRLLDDRVYIPLSDLETETFSLGFCAVSE